jgi:diguanylate cyclase (GGDEF)-like protein/PAS domain S-box-containing protein
MDAAPGTELQGQIFEQSPVVQLLVEPTTGRIVEANAAALAFYQLSRDELRGRSFCDFSPTPESFELPVFSSGGSVERSVMVKQRLPSGAYRDVELRTGAVSLGGRELLHVVLEDFSDRVRAEASLRDSERRFRDLFDNAPVGYHEVDAEGRYVRVNDTELAMLGYTRDEVIGRYAWEFVVEEISRAAIDAKLAGALDLAPFERTFIAKSGEHIPVLLEDRLILEPNGRASGIRTTVLDIGDRKRAEQALRESEERYRQLVELSPDAIAVHRRGRIVFVNPACVKLFGATHADELVGRHAIDFVHPDHRKRAQRRGLWTHKRGTPAPLLQQTLIRLDGSPVEVEVATMSFSSNDERVIQVVMRDVTERRQAEEQIKALAYHDTLTGLPNRLLFADRVATALMHGARLHHRVAVLFIDLDRFKIINDSLGHGFGDKLLCKVAERIRSVVRDGDTLARRGGDEFTLLLPEVTDADGAKLVAIKVLEALRRPFEIEGRELFVTASMGAALYPEDGRDVDTLVKHSDVAMYRAKDHGRDNCQLFTPAMNERALEKLSMENALRRALANDEFVVHYQPLVDHENARILGVEALIRWRHPELGLVSPDDFIPIAEMTGLIVPIGPWVLRVACAQVRAWQLAGFPGLCVSVNLSARQFAHPELVDQVRDVLRQTGLSPECLDLEITETNAMSNIELSSAILREIKALGVRISIDDFGIGYSSLSYLKRLPIDTLKIHHSFVRDVPRDPDNAAIVRAVLAMAHSLKLRVVAEGVESAEQVGFLLEHGCDVLQGFYFSPPVPAEQCERVLARLEETNVTGVRKVGQPLSELPGGRAYALKR